MGAGGEVGMLRWARCLVELVRAACHMCPTSLGVAYLEVLHKLSRYVPHTAPKGQLLPLTKLGVIWEPWHVSGAVKAHEMRNTSLALPGAA